MKGILVCFLASALVALPAHANPIMTMVNLTVVQVPGTQDVLVTFKYIFFVSPPATITRDYATIPVSWTPTHAKLTYDNTGSGTQGATSAQWCDCNLPLGRHTYEVTVDRSSIFGWSNVSLTVSQPQPEPLDASAGSPDAAPWDASAPAVTALNCAAVCPAVAVDAGSSGGATSTGGQGPTSGTSGTLSNSGGGSDTGGVTRGGDSSATGGTYTAANGGQGGDVLLGTGGYLLLTGGNGPSANGGAGIGGVQQGGNATATGGTRPVVDGSEGGAVVQGKGGLSSTSYVKETGTCSCSVPRRSAVNPILVLAFGLLCGTLRRRR